MGRGATKKIAESVGDSKSNDDVRLDDLSELQKFCARFPDVMNEARLRWLIFNRKSNGIEECGAVVKRGGRWYVVGPRLRDWLLRGGPS